MSKISACLIVRDEAETLPRLLKQLRPHVDELVVLDTGSKDGTPAIARKYADRFSVCLDFNNPDTGLIEDFAGARNRAMEMCSGEWLFWCDGDDEIRGAEHLRALAEQSREDNVRIFLPYEYAHDAQGRCVCLQWRERLMRPIQWLTWMSPVHEVCMPVAGAPGTFGDAKNDQVRIIHRKGESKKPLEPQRNLRILKAYVAKVGEGDVRALYYLGVEAAHAGDMGTALRNLKRYIQLSGWDDEKVMAQLEIARIYRSIGDHESAIHWATEAMLTKSWPEPYWELAKSFYALGWQNVRRDYNYARAAHFIQLGLNMQNDTLLFENPMERSAIHELLNVCLLSAGNLEGAIASCEEGLAGMPENEPLKTNLAKYRAERRKRMVTGLLGEMVRAGDIDKQQEVVIRNTLTGGFQVQLLDEPREVEIKREERRADPGKLDIVFFVGHGLEPWNGQTIQETGMGGSETMEWELARRLARMGHRVRLFGHCTPTMEGLFDGVEFLDQGRYRNLDCDVLIASRRPDAVDDSHNVHAKVRLLHIHDVHVGEGLTHERAYRLDGILALSQWHKRCLMQVYPTLPEQKIIVTRNGLDLSRFGQSPAQVAAQVEVLYSDYDTMIEALNAPRETIQRHPHRAVFSSSPDRGLQALLDMWPRIREQVKDAELRIFYSFNNWEAVARMNNDRAQLQQIANLKHLASTLPGVTLCGRVNQKQLAEEFMAAGVLLYPTHFHETSCAHPDTRISVPGDHRGGPPTVRIADMVGKEPFPVYAFNEAENRFQIATCLRVWETKIADELVGLELDSGEVLKLTPDHRVLTFDGDWVEAGTLKEGDSLRALHYRYNVAIRDGNGRWTNEHRLVGEWKTGRRLLTDEHVDHTDLQRLDNRPEALTVMTAAEHFSKTHKGKRLSRKHVDKKAALMKATLARLPLEEKQARGRAAGAKAWEKIRAMPEAESEAFYARRARVRSERRAERIEAAVPEQYSLLAANDARWGRNHKVIRVFRIAGPIPVYDMEVDGLHNFVADGVVIHNCVTAMEAQAAGMRIVTSKLAALPETVGEWGTLLPVDEANLPHCISSSPVYQDAFIKAAVEAMTTKDGSDRPKRIEAAKRFDMDELAREWSRLLEEMHAKLSEDVIGPFQEVAQ